MVERKILFPLTFRPIHYAFRTGNIEITKLLLSYNVDVTITNKIGYTILHEASRFGNFTLLEWFLKNFDEKVTKELLEKQSKFGATALHLACKKKKSKCVELLYSPSPKHLITIKHHTILHSSLASGKLDNAYFIMKKGDINPLKRDRHSASCIHYVSMNERQGEKFNNLMYKIVIEMLEWIKKNKEFKEVITLKDKFQNNPLHYSMFHGWKDIVFEFLKFYDEYEKGQETHPILEKNVDGFTPVQLCDAKILDEIKVYLSFNKLTTS